MQIYRKSQELANKFEEEYPKDLPARLEWFCHALDIDRTRLLRMIGMSAEQARKNQSRKFKDILATPAWNEQALLVEGSLHRLLSLFHYDWHALADHIRGSEDRSRVTREKGLDAGYGSNGGSSDLVANYLAEGRPQSLAGLLAYLAASPSGADRVES